MMRTLHVGTLDADVSRADPIHPLTLLFALQIVVLGLIGAYEVHPRSFLSLREDVASVLSVLGDKLIAQVVHLLEVEFREVEATVARKLLVDLIEEGIRLRI